jgi:peptidoglycan hydrolase CwlO-like protein
MECALNASPNEVALILDAIKDVREEVKEVKSDVSIIKTDVGAMDKRINGRIRKLEDGEHIRANYRGLAKLVAPGVIVGVAVAVITTVL